MINKEEVMIGSDFEFFLENNDGKIISSIPYHTGTKLAPEQMEREGCCVQKDNVLTECNVPPVSLEGAEEFWNNVEYCKEFVNKRVAPHGLKLKCCAAATLDKDQMKHKDAHVFG